LQKTYQRLRMCGANSASGTPKEPSGTMQIELGALVALRPDAVVTFTVQV
jgi:hypothetical protein